MSSVTNGDQVTTKRAQVDVWAFRDLNLSVPLTVAWGQLEENDRRLEEEGLFLPNNSFSEEKNRLGLSRLLEPRRR